jgi:GAF domain-containing protein
MVDWAQRFFTPPTFESEDDTRNARLLNVVLWTLLLLSIASTVATVLTNLGDAVGMLSGVLLSGVFVLPFAAGQWLVRSGHVRLASGIVVAFLYVGFVFAAAVSGGVAAPIFSIFVLLIVLSSLLLRARTTAILAGLIILTGIGFLYGESTAGWIEPQIPSPLFGWLTYSLLIVFSVVLLLMSSTNTRDALERARIYAQEMEHQQEQLQESAADQANDMARRNRHMQAIAGIFRDISLLRDEDTLLSSAVASMGERLDLCHAAVYWLDRTGDGLLPRAAFGLGASDLLVRQNQVTVNSDSVLARVASGSGVQVRSEIEPGDTSWRITDVAGTRSEIVLPLQLSGEVVGVLDLQSETSGAFMVEDGMLFQIFADQISLAIANARSFSDAQARLDAERRAYGDLTGDAWRQMLRTSGELGVLRNDSGLSVSPNVWRPEMGDAISSGQVAVRAEDAQVVAIPIVARGHVIGVIDARKPENEGEWTRQEIELMEALRDQLGEALENARLYQDVQRREVQERLVSEATSRMRESLDVESVLQVAVQEISRSLGLAALDVKLGVGSDGDE